MTSVRGQRASLERLLKPLLQENYKVSTEEVSSESYGKKSVRMYYDPLDK